MEEVISKHPCEILKTGTLDEITAYLAMLNDLPVPAIIALLKNTQDKDDYFLLYYVWQKFTLITECGFQHIIDAANAANAPAKITLFKACDDQGDAVRLHRFLKEGMDPRLLNFYLNLDGYVAQHDDDKDKTMDDKHYLRAVFLLEYGANASEQTLRKLLQKTLELNLDGAELHLEILLQRNPGIFQRYNALLRAAHKGNLEIVRWLVQHGVDVNGKHEETEDTALHWASTVFVVRYLVKKGALVDARNKNLATPLHRAILRHDSRVAQCLIEAGADLTVREISGLSFMVMVIERHLNELLECLIDHGADIDEVLEGGLTLIDCAIRERNDTAVEILTAAKERKRSESAQTQSPRRVVLGDSPLLSRTVNNMGGFPEELTPRTCGSKTSPRNS